MRSPLRVLHYVGSLRRGGIETWLVNLVRKLPPNVKFDFVLESQPGESGAYEDEVLAAGCRVFHLPPVSRRDKRLRKLGLQRDPMALREVLQKVAPDVFHVHGEEFMGGKLREAHRAGVPVRIAHCHNTQLARGKSGVEMALRRIWFRTGERRLMLRHATDFAACSDLAGHLLLGAAWTTTPTARVVYCGVSLAAFERAGNEAQSRPALLAKYGFPEDAWIVGHAGSMGPTHQKNHGFLITVFAELAKRDARWRLFLAGDGPLRPDLQRQVEALGLSSLVAMPGLCSDVPVLMTHMFDVHLMPSLFEGLPVAGIEAAAAGLFTVCSDSITREFGANLPGRVEYQPLSAPPSVWADRVEQARLSRIPSREGLKLVQNSPFSIEASMDELLRLYVSQVTTPAKPQDK